MDRSIAASGPARHAPLARDGASRRRAAGSPAAAAAGSRWLARLPRGEPALSCSGGPGAQLLDARLHLVQAPLLLGPRKRPPLQRHRSGEGERGGRFDQRLHACQQQQRRRRFGERPIRRLDHERSRPGLPGFLPRQDRRAPSTRTRATPQRGGSGPGASPRRPWGGYVCRIPARPSTVSQLHTETARTPSGRRTRPSSLRTRSGSWTSSRSSKATAPWKRRGLEGEGVDVRLLQRDARRHQGRRRLQHLPRVVDGDDPPTTALRQDDRPVRESTAGVEHLASGQRSGHPTVAIQPSRLHTGHPGAMSGTRPSNRPSASSACHEEDRWLAAVPIGYPLPRAEV